MITNLTLFAVFMQMVSAISIDGQVRDALTRKPIPLVKVELSHQGVPSAVEYTNAEGRFHFGNVNPGSYNISAASIDYDAKTVEFDSSMGPFVELVLTRTRHPKENGAPVVSLRDYMIPESARKEFNKARKDIRRQDCPNAIKHLENGLRFVGPASALNDLGNCYRKLSDFENAERSFKRAIELSDSVYIALNLADLYATQNRFSEAETVLDTAIRRTPGNGDAYYGLAVAYFKQGRLENAQAAAIQADSRPHRIADLHLLLAKIYARQNPKQAIEQLDLYLKEAPNGPESERVRQALKKASH